jgi:hydrogenase maturation factor HypF (carbamoyltransferase family)
MNRNNDKRRMLRRSRGSQKNWTTSDFKQQRELNGGNNHRPTYGITYKKPDL